MLKEIYTILYYNNNDYICFNLFGPNEKLNKFLVKTQEYFYTSVYPELRNNEQIINNHEINNFYLAKS